MIRRKALPFVVPLLALACGEITEIDTGSPYEESLVVIPDSEQEFTLRLHYQGNSERITKRLRFPSTAIWRITSFKGIEEGEQWVRTGDGDVLYEQTDGNGDGPCFRVCGGTEHEFLFWSDTRYYEAMLVTFKQQQSCSGTVAQLSCG